MNKQAYTLFLIVSVAISLSFIVLPVQATTTYANDGFESFATGWTTGSGNTGVILKSGEQKHGGSYSVVSNATASTAYGYAYNNTATISVNFRYSIWIYVPSGFTQYGILVSEVYDGTVVDFITGIVSNSTGYYLSLGNPTGAYVNVTSISSNTWTHIEEYYVRASGILHIYKDSVKIGGDWTTEVLTNKNPNRFYLGDVSGTGTQFNGKIFYDDLLIDDAAEPSQQTQQTFNGSISFSLSEASSTRTIFSQYGNIPVTLSPSKIASWTFTVYKSILFSLASASERATNFSVASTIALAFTTGSDTVWSMLEHGNIPMQFLTAFQQPSILFFQQGHITFQFSLESLSTILPSIFTVYGIFTMHFSPSLINTYPFMVPYTPLTVTPTVPTYLIYAVIGFAVICLGLAAENERRKRR